MFLDNENTDGVMISYVVVRLEATHTPTTPIPLTMIVVMMVVVAVLVGLPVAGVTGAWELPDVGAGTVYSDLSSLLSDQLPSITRVFSFALVPK